LKVTFGWNIGKYANFNVTAMRLQRGCIAPSTLALIEEVERLDIQLYQNAMELFEHQFTRQSHRATVELEAIRQAKGLGRFERFNYKSASAIRKAISRLHSAI